MSDDLKVRQSLDTQRDGMNACAAGEARSANPHPDGTANHRWWREGWDMQAARANASIEPDTISQFAGDHGFLSNFYRSPIIWQQRECRTVEHAYQASKARTAAEFDKVCRAQSPGLAKYMGRTLTMRNDWEHVKRLIMLDLLRLKFAIPELRAQLLATAPKRLIEGNWWHDNIWGVCLCQRCRAANIEGENALGKQLEKVRAESRLFGDKP